MRTFSQIRSPISTRDVIKKGVTQPSTVKKPWGHELIWARTSLYVGKILHIRAGEALSLQYHRVKDETIMVLAGRLLFQFFAEGAEQHSFEMLPGETHAYPVSAQEQQLNDPHLQIPTQGQA